MRVKVINLESSSARRSEISDKLVQDNCAFDIVAAVDTRQYCVRDFKIYSPIRAILKFGRRLRGGELGCFLSHRKCLQEFLAEPDQFCLILEDDVDWRHGTSLLMQELEIELQNIDREWHVMNIGNQVKRSKLFLELKTLSGGQKIGWAFDFPMTTHAMIWNKLGAKKFLDETTSISEPIDVFTRKFYSRNGFGLGVLTPILRQANLDSDINGMIFASSPAYRIFLPSLWRKFQRRLLRRSGLHAAARAYKRHSMGQ